MRSLTPSRMSPPSPCLHGNRISERGTPLSSFHVGSSSPRSTSAFARVGQPLASLRMSFLSFRWKKWPYLRREIGYPEECDETDDCDPHQEGDADTGADVVECPENNDGRDQEDRYQNIRQSNILLSRNHAPQGSPRTYHLHLDEPVRGVGPDRDFGPPIGYPPWNLPTPLILVLDLRRSRR